VKIAIAISLWSATIGCRFTVMAIVDGPLANKNFAAWRGLCLTGREQFRLIVGGEKEMAKYPEMDWGTMEAIVNKLGGMEGVKRFLSDGLTLKASDLLKQVAQVSVSATRKFIASAHIQSANIVWMSENFQRLFLNKKVEEDVPAGKLVVSKLQKASTDASIMAELGAATEIQLAHFFQKLEGQSNGQAGPLLTNGYAIIAYIIGSDENFWAVGAHWYAGRRGWYVCASSVDDQDEWHEGLQILSQVFS